MDRGAAIELLDFHRPQVQARFAGLPAERLMAELHAVDARGRVFRGAEAIREILKRQRGLLGWTAALWRLPGFGWLAGRHYRLVAGWRYGFAAKAPARAAAQRRPGAAS
ncbi:MAG: DUF393 domain-containing protein [Deltaproteobacteria bacterium]|nr:DUF393 domain-containing protein [Deltaproteobacteria bacterium]